MTTQSQNETIWQGEELTLTITEKDSAVPPVEVDLAGATLRWEMWHVLKGIVLTKTTATGGITILDQLAHKGECVVTLTHNDTKDLAPLTYWHGLYHDPLVGDADMVMEGFITVKSSRGLEA